MAEQRDGLDPKGDRRPTAAKAVAVAAVVLSLAVTGFVLGRALTGGGTDCSVVASRVSGLDGFAWDNGITSSGSEWISVLTDGATRADDASRRSIAAAVRADDDGFRRFRTELPADEASAAERLREFVVDPDASASRVGATHERDATTLQDFGLDECGLA